MAWLGYYLAARGYIAAAVNHLGNAEEERQLGRRFFLSDWQMWERPKDLTAVLDKLLADPVFGARIDRNRIAAAGFSLGGYTVIAAAGGVINLKELQANSPPPPPELREAIDRARAELAEVQKTDAVVQESARHAGDSYRDPRIRCVFALAPALGGGFTKAGLSTVTIPVRIVVGRADSVTPLAFDAQRYADLIPGAKLTILPGEVGHWTRDEKKVDRAAVLRQVSQLAFEFFEQGFTKK
jgi:predicted dienelactone hydrolase